MSAHIASRSHENTHDDARLAHAVAGTVRSRCGRAVVEFSAEVHQGIVTLNGQVRGYYKKQVMLAAAQGVPGVEQVIDRVVVLPLQMELCGQDSGEFDVFSVA